MNITSTQLDALSVRASQEDLKTLLAWLKEDGEIVVVADEPVEDDPDFNVDGSEDRSVPTATPFDGLSPEALAPREEKTVFPEESEDQLVEIDAGDISEQPDVEPDAALVEDIAGDADEVGEEA